MAYRITEEEYQAIKAKEKETKNKQISKKLKVLMLRYEASCIIQTEPGRRRVEKEAPHQ